MADAINLAATIPKHQVTILRKYFNLSFMDNLVFSPTSGLVSLKNDITGKDLNMIDWDMIAPVTQALTDGTDVEAKILSENSMVFTPVEWGNAVKWSKLSELQSAGAIKAAAPKIVAYNAAESVNLLAITRLRQTTNVLVANEAASQAALVATDLIQATDLDYVHNRMKRAKVPKMKSGHYIGIVNADVASDLKQLDDYEKVNTYYSNVALLDNEIGAYKGFRFVETQSNSPIEDGGSTTIDAYESIFMGARALTYTQSLPISLVFTVPEDYLKRKTAVGWYGVFNFDIFKEAAVWKIQSASSFGDNAA